MPLFDPWTLRIAPLRFQLVTRGEFRAPEYKGAVFRGGFGQFFRDLVCATSAPVCGGCRRIPSCPYALVFETPVQPEKFTVLRKYPNAPHPLVMTPPLDGRNAIPPGETMALDVTLIGPGIEYLPHVIRVVEAMGEKGWYGGRFRLQSVVNREPPRGLVYDGGARQFRGEPRAWQPAPQGPVRRMNLDFVTPLRMRTEGRYNTRPGFVAVTQALLRRIHLLQAVHGDGDGDASWMYPLLRLADGAVTERADFDIYEWDRMSGRQGRRVAMDGVVGRLTASGELTELAPYFEAGERVHVGSGTSMGLGKYVARFE